jgi:hypothetical protein
MAVSVWFLVYHMDHGGGSVGLMSVPVLKGSCVGSDGKIVGVGT